MVTDGANVHVFEVAAKRLARCFDAAGPLSDDGESSALCKALGGEGEGVVAATFPLRQVEQDALFIAGRRHHATLGAGLLQERKEA